MEEFAKTSCSDLITLWIDINRPETQWKDEGRPADSNTSVNYNKCIENIETVILLVNVKLQLLTYCVVFFHVSQTLS